MSFIPAGVLADARAIYNANLTDPCTIQRLTPADDATGGPAIPTAQIISPAGLKCRLTQGGGPPQVREQLVALQLSGIQAYILKLPLGTDCKRNDQVTVNGETFQVIGTSAAQSNTAGLYALIQAVGATP